MITLVDYNDMTKLEQHRKIWQGKSDEWLFERLANELAQKVEEIHKLLAENEQLRIANVVNRRGQLECDCTQPPFRYNELGTCKYCGKQKKEAL